MIGKQTTHTNPEISNDLLAYAIAQSGIERDILLADMARCESGIGRITGAEYINFGLYDWQTYSQESRLSFLSNRLHWPIVFKSCDTSWFAMTEDKWAMETILKRSSIPTPPILAIVDKSYRIYSGIRQIRDLTQFRDFLVANDGAAFFGKQLRGMESVGIFLCEESDADEVEIFGEGKIPVSTLFERICEFKYILQPVIKNHKFFHDQTQSLCTLRIAVFVYDDMLNIAYSFLKMPAGNNLTDRFSNPQNLALGIDTNTGQITSIRERLSIGSRELPTHPVTGLPLVGSKIPFWSETMKLAARVAQVFAPVRYQSMDIAITDTGPVLIEVNTGGGFKGPQLAYGTGLLQPKFTHFFDVTGVDLVALGAQIPTATYFSL